MAERALALRMKSVVLACALLVGALAWIAAGPSPPPTHTSFILTRAGRPVTVWYFVPAGATSDTPVVFVMHGVSRNAEDYLADWIPYAQRQVFLVVVPEFSEKGFPGAEGYAYGNTVDKAGRPVAREQWSFSMIEPAFDAVRDKLGNYSERYSIYGHSAGAQFVQRFIYFVPRARVLRAVCANAGWYMLPDLDVAFPYGLKNTEVSDADLRHALGLPMVVLLGTADVDPHHPQLRHTPESEAQGAYRFARGKFFFARGEEVARTLGTPFGWRLAEAPGIAHSDRGMAPFAVRALFPD